MKLFRSVLLVFIANLTLIDAHPNLKIRQIPTAFTHIAVIDTANASLQPGMTVVIVGDHITDVDRAENIKVPSTAEVIDGRGKFLMPGLWDMHVHVFNQVTRRPPNTWCFPLFV